MHSFYFRSFKCIIIQETNVLQYNNLYCVVTACDYVSGQLVWPVCRHFVFPEFLLASGQHLLIQEYVRLLHGWCEWNNCSRKFLLGSALLDMGEPYKAYDLLVQAAKGITTDDFMASKLVSSAESLSEQHRLVLYYLKVWLVDL